MKAAPSSWRVSTKRMSLRPYISVTMLLVVVPTTPNVWSTPSARRASTTARPAFICAMGSLALRVNDGGRAADDERLVALQKVGDHLGERLGSITADRVGGVVDEDEMAVRDRRRRFQHESAHALRLGQREPQRRQARIRAGHEIDVREAEALDDPPDRRPRVGPGSARRQGLEGDHTEPAGQQLVSG